MLLYKDIHFNQFLKGVELHYAGPARIDPSEVKALEDKAKEQIDEAYARGRQEAIDELNEQILHNRQEVQHLLGQTLEGIDRKVGETMKEVVDEIPTLVTNIARRVLAEIEIDGNAVKAIVDEVIGDLPSNKDQVDIYLSPDDYKLLMGHVQNLSYDYPHCSFIEDVNMNSADCRVESKFGAIDATVDTKLKHIEEQLGA